MKFVVIMFAVPEKTLCISKLWFDSLQSAQDFVDMNVANDDLLGYANDYVYKVVDFSEIEKFLTYVK